MSQNKKGQVSIEFTFAMIMTLLMAFSIIKLFDWSGRDLIHRRVNHEDVLLQSPASGVTRDYTSGTAFSDMHQLRQISPGTLPPRRINAVWDGK